MTDKRHIRAAMATLNRSFQDDAAARLSARTCRRLATTEAFRQARCIALYCATNGEVQTAELIEEWKDKKRIVLPVVVGANMAFYPYEGKERLIVGTFGILSPDTQTLSPVDVACIDLFVVPGMAFDRACNRLGHGKGYYDRYLSAAECFGKPVVGLCFGYQLLDERIPVEAHDISMSMIVTEDEVIVSPHRL